MKQQKIKTSIIIPVYNTKRYLDTCIDSVIRQTQQEIEIIIVDDGSTDGSSEVIREYAEKYPFIQAVYQKNEKLGSARNVGIRQAKGQYIYFLDSDDYIREDLLEKCYQKAEMEQLDFVIFDAVSFCDVDKSNSRLDPKKWKYDRSDLQIRDKVYSGIEFWNNYYFMGGVYPNAVLVYANKEFILKNRLFFESGVYYEDNDWIIRMYYYAKRVSYIQQQFYFRRLHETSIMGSNYGRIHLKSTIFLCEKMLNMLLHLQETSLKNMIRPVLKNLLFQFGDILIYCNKNQIKEIDSFEVSDFYKNIVDMYLSFDDHENDIKNILLAVADLIKKEGERSDTLINLPNLRVEEYKRNLVLEDFMNYSLNKEEKIIGIYGSGLMFDKFSKLYQEYFGDIKASVFLIDSYQKSCENYKGYQLYNIKDIENEDIDCIIITSLRNREELLENVKKLIKNKDIEIWCLPKYIQYFR